MALADAPSSVFGRDALEGGLDVVDVLAAVGLVKSKTAARLALSQGGVYVNNRRLEGDGARRSNCLTSSLGAMCCYGARKRDLYFSFA